MKAELIIFEHASNGLALHVVPETDAERKLLDGLWKHGRMEHGHPHDHLIRWYSCEDKLKPALVTVVRELRERDEKPEG